MMAEATCATSIKGSIAIWPLACGTPVVCSHAGSLPEVVGDAALSLAPDDLPGWVDAMERILHDEALRSELRARGLARAREFTWERTARQTLAVYQEVAAA